MYCYATDLKAFNEALDRGELCQIDRAMYWYYLEVLPPVLWQRHVTLTNGKAHYADFGFAEGEELITAFWQVEKPYGHYYAQRTKFMNRGA